MARRNARAGFQNRSTHRTNLSRRQDTAGPGASANRRGARHQTGRGRRGHGGPNASLTADPDASTNRRRSRYDPPRGPTGLAGPNGSPPTREIRRSHTALGQFLESYQVPAQYAARRVTIEMLRNVACFITLFQVRHNPRVDKPVQHWTGEHITSILHRVFEGCLPGDTVPDCGGWPRVDVRPEPNDPPRPQSGKPSVGVFITDRPRKGT